MSTTITIAGKGGTGKTTIAALLIHFLSQKGVVLAVDGDPSTNLNQVLGLPLKGTIGDVREDLTRKLAKGQIGAGVSKQDLLEAKIMESLVESEKIDLVAMGRPDGPGCYCMANHLLRVSLDRLENNYDFVVIDCEAGMEHISRQTTRDVDVLLLITDPTVRGITAAARMRDLTEDLHARVKVIHLVVNRLRGELPPMLRETISSFHLELLSTIPEDPGLPELEVRGAPLGELPPDSPLRQGVKEVLQKIGL